MNTITINGKTFTVPDGPVSIVADRVIVNGQVIQSGLSGIVQVKWDGPLASLDSEASVTCGDVHGNVKAAGSVNCNNVTGDVKAGGSVNCENVGGNVRAGGSVKCENVNVRAAGINWPDVQR